VELIFDCSDKVLAYHDDKVTLPQAKRTEMHESARSQPRPAVRREGCQEPAPREFVSQGSYAMRNMVRHPEKDYEIDDGATSPRMCWWADRGAEAEYYSG
jgi:hypothetical protein